jgi:hypothetical protein
MYSEQHLMKENVINQLLLFNMNILIYNQRLIPEEYKKYILKVMEIGLMQMEMLIVIHQFQNLLRPIQLRIIQLNKLV